MARQRLLSNNTGTRTIIPAYPLSPCTLLHDFVCGTLAEFIINKLIIFHFVLHNQSLKLARKYAFYGEMVCPAIIVSVPVMHLKIIVLP